MSDVTSEQLACRAAAAAAMRPAFLANVLARFRTLEGLDDDGLARFLGLSRLQLCWLGLCRRPRPDQFAADIGAIASRFAIEPARLASLIRQVDALAALAEANRQPSGLLAAARDHDEPDPAPEDHAP